MPLPFFWQVADHSIEDIDFELWDSQRTSLLGTCMLSMVPLLLGEVSVIERHKVPIVSSGLEVGALEISVEAMS